MVLFTNAIIFLVSGATAFAGLLPVGDQSPDSIAVDLNTLFGEIEEERNNTVPELFPDSIQKRASASPTGTFDGCLWNVPGVGSFNSRSNVSDFTQSSSNRGLFKAITRTGYPKPYYDKVVNHETVAVRWDLVNIGMSSDKSVTLTVPGGQSSSGPASCAMLQTNWTDILHGSVRTVAKVGSVPGSVHAAYFYLNDTQEFDIEFQTGNPNYALWTNQGGDTYNTSVSTSTTAYHEYRVDWVPGKTMFYVDGTLAKTITDHVPVVAGPWQWTSW
jgi:hypothetical protein